MEEKVLACSLGVYIYIYIYMYIYIYIRIERIKTDAFPGGFFSWFVICSFSLQMGYDNL